MKGQKGITLVALIITIIVLLILALVTIASISGDDSLFNHANNAGTKYNEQSKYENQYVYNAIQLLDEYEQNN